MVRDGRVMRVAALYDIHGNLPALEAVLEDVRRAGVDVVVVGGDVVPGPMPRETIERLLSLDVPMQCIQGNGDREVVARRRGIETGSVPEKFRESSTGWPTGSFRTRSGCWPGWPGTIRVPIHGLGEVLFCHATPRNDTDIFTRLTPEAPLLPIFNEAGAAMVVCGHTHMQFDRTIGTTRVVNAGSVGMPFDEPGAYWLLLGPGVELRRTAYDLEKAAERIRSTSYPQADAFASRNVLRPPTERETIEAFARVEVK